MPTPEEPQTPLHCAVRMRLFGPPQVELDTAVASAGGSEPPRPAAQALAFERRHQLVAWLALKGGWIGRPELAALLWPEQESRLALTNLRKALHRLQEVPWAAALQTSGQALRFAAETDVQAFEAALAADRLDDALALYGGELLAGFDDDANSTWSERLRFERERLHAAWRGAALQRLEQTNFAGSAAAEALAARLVALDPLDEAAVAAQLRVLARRGQVAAARAAFRAYGERLRSELGIAPGAALKAEHDALGSAVGAASSAASSPASSAAASGDVADAATGGAAAAATADDAMASSSTRAASAGAARAAADEGFVGRSIELQHIAELLAQDDCTVLALLGPGGIGKTRLARRAMQLLAPRFADGAAFVPLEDAAGTAEVGAHLAGALGLSLTGREPALDEVRRALAPRAMLLVLDNFEHLAEDAAWLDALRSDAPRLKVLVTSRVRPRVQALWTLPLEGLPYPGADDEDRLEAFDAARLFVRAARRVEPGLVPATEAAAIVDICRQVEGLPLALELAASFTRVLSCEAIAAELRAGTELLRAADPARPARQASLEAVFEQSWRHLAPAERQALTRLAVFRGGFSAAAARQVAGASLPVLAALTDKSLLRKEGARCHLHPLVQQFALERLGDGPEHAAAAAAHARHFLRLLAETREALALARPEAMRAMEDDLDNVHAAWRHATAHGPAGELARAALGLMDFCDHRGRWHEGLAMMREALAAPQAAAEPQLLGALGAAAAHLEHRLDRYAQAEALATRALAAARDGGDTAAEMQAAKVLAATCLRLGRLPEARRWYRRTLHLAETTGDARTQAGTLDNLSLIERQSGRIDAALALSQQALARHRALADIAGEALCLNNQSVLLAMRGELDETHATLQAGLKLCQQHGLLGTRTLIELNLADLADRRGDLDGVERYARSALALSEQRGQRATATTAHQLLMEAARQRGDLAAARREFAAAVELALSVGRPVLKVNLVYQAASLLAAHGEQAIGAALMNLALAQPAIVGDDRERGEALVREWGGRVGAPWPGPPLDELLQRMQLEAGQAFAPLLAQLREQPA